ncbi:hypothetical protein KRR38_18240 [Novosphingobium sp. G106]|uniref:hypothetical protein n=1 Tax=Novosphingobium sp. G106 TaxID=2849500 RepID=UPI001C2DC31F|nr:hypothetical protein [Novosphingobium sp. G106]MBV1689567.1 hypothetical protein [Novosphingobium sp. G106]
MGRSGIGLARAGRRRLYGGTPTPAPAPFTAIAADGWQATVGSPADLSLLPATATRQGFDTAGAATTHIDTLFLTKRVWQAYPAQASFTASSQALSDYVYSTDTIAGAVNNSTETSPKPVAAWVMTDRRIVGNSLDLECVAFHRNGRGGKPVACVVFRATDGTTTVTATASAMVVSPGSYDRCAVLVYRATIDISSLSDNANITCNAKVYPWIGGSGSVLDSADQSAAREFSPRVFRKNTSRAAAPYIVRVKATGNDGTGAVSTSAATADASPCLTLIGAINRARAVLGTAAGSLDGLRIQLDAGTWARTSSPSASNTINAEVVIEPIPGVAKASCIVTFGVSNNGFDLAYFRMRSLTVRRVGLYSNNGTQTVYEDCAIDYNGNTDTPLAISGTNMYFEGCDFGTGSLALNGHVSSFHALHRGCTGGVANSNDQREYYVVVGCEWTGGRGEPTIGRSQNGTVIAFNKFMKHGNAGGGGMTLTGSGTLAGAAIVQNLFEWTSTGAQLILRVSADGDTLNTSHVILWHNTMVGAFAAGRSNVFYDETTGTARTHKLMSCKSNIHVQINTKSDVFKTDGTRTGNFAYEHGVGCDGEFSQFVDAASGGVGTSFAQEYPGLRGSLGTSPTTRNDPLFTSYAGATYNGSTYTAGAGGGTYTLQAGSPCLARLPVAVLSHDLAGIARAAADNAAGAYA